MKIITTTSGASKRLDEILGMQESALKKFWLLVAIANTNPQNVDQAKMMPCFQIVDCFFSEEKELS